MAASIENVYPVGSIYMSVKDTNPSSLFGGRWERWGQGRVPVGVSGCGTFGSVESTGGSEKHRLSISELPSHGGHIPDKQYRWSNSGEDTFFINVKNGLNNNIVQKHGVDRPFVLRAGNELAMSSCSEGGGCPHNNLQPYITCYMWKRIQ